MLTMLLGLARLRATSNEVDGLIATAAKRSDEDPLSGVVPELAGMLRELTKDH
ncbi:hypothetical protein QTH87_25590 [Variovorax sp. J22P168]|uniref:hypothetical protein n=1 Tax=Variovorax jilinensis TaxID=3053513 RepID=UPI0025780CC9|nr:hypothetical protein [Variovorax sp. J22P168]MDM0015838.1 hypothetical protein [Variovorax sp. J22P168]